MDETTVGIVLVPHSRELAEGAAEVAAQIGAGGARIMGVGGAVDGRLGTSIDALAAAVGKLAGPAGVLVIPDLGSSVLTARSYLTDADALPGPVVLADAPFVEGAVAAAVLASTGATLSAVVAAAEGARDVRKL